MEVYIVTLETYGPYDENKDIYLNKWFDVPADWLVYHLPKGYHSLGEFLDNYTWDETLFIYEQAVADDVIVYEREV